MGIHAILMDTNTSEVTSTNVRKVLMKAAGPTLTQSNFLQCRGILQSSQPIHTKAWLSLSH